AIALGNARDPAIFDTYVAPDAPTVFLQSLQKRRVAGLALRIIRSLAHEHPDPPHPPALLRPCRQRPRGSRGTEEREEGAAVHGWTLHSIASSARTSTVAGTSRPSSLAVLRLTTSSYLVGFCTGSSAGFSPLRMRST